MDRLTAERRSWLMSRIRSRDTKPELAVRSLVHGMGFRYRLHRADLPGKPDLVFPRLRRVIFVHGCFWHGHHCKVDKMPKSRIDFWSSKIEANKKRDERSRRSLKAMGWTILVVWECETKNAAKLSTKLRRFLDAAG